MCIRRFFRPYWIAPQICLVAVVVAWSICSMDSTQGPVGREHRTYRSGQASVRSSVSAVTVKSDSEVGAEVVSDGSTLVLDTESTPDKISRLMREAEFFYRKKCYRRASNRLDQVLKYDPGNVRVMEGQIQVKNTWSDSEDPSKKTLQSAYDLYGASDFAGSAGLYLRYMAEHPEATQEIRPLVLKCYYNLGIIALRQGRCDLASEYFSQSLLMDAQDIRSKQGLILVKDCRAHTSAGQFLNVSLAQ